MTFERSGDELPARQQRAEPSAVVISMRMSGHAGPSGYDRLVDYLPCNVIRPPVNWSFSQRAVAKVLKPLIRKAGSQWYQRGNLICELAAGARWWRDAGQVFHFLYGENSYCYLGRLKKFGKPKPIVCTYHLPQEKFRRIVYDTRPIRRLDAVVVVSTVQRDIFSDLVGQDRIHYIPHGVDVQYFQPPTTPAKSNKFRCLFVGSHLRDFDVLTAAARILRGKEIEFVVVTSPSEYGRFSGLDNVTLLNGVSDKELLALYQSSQLFVMPVTDATTNNALLEAMACGLPTIMTDIVGIRDYVDESAAVLTKRGDVSSFVDGINYLYGNDSRRMDMGRAARERALALSWERVADQVTTLYGRLI